MHRDTKFDDIGVDTHNHYTTILTMLISKIIRTQFLKIFLACGVENKSKPCSNGGSVSYCINKANWKLVGGMGVLWHICLLRGKFKKHRQEKNLCFVLNLINVLCSLTSFY